MGRINVTKAIFAEPSGSNTQVCQARCVQRAARAAGPYRSVGVAACTHCSVVCCGQTHALSTFWPVVVAAVISAAPDRSSTGHVLGTPACQRVDIFLGVRRDSPVLSWHGADPGTPPPRHAPGQAPLHQHDVHHPTHALGVRADLDSSQRSLHNAPIFRRLLKVAVNGTHQCD